MNLSSRTRTPTQAQTADAAKYRDLSARLAALEARITSSPAAPFPILNSPSLADVERLKALLARKEKELAGADKLLNDCVAENDVLFERFNEELVKMSNGFKLGKGEAEVLEMLRQLREEQGRLKRENMYVPGFLSFYLWGKWWTN